MEVHTTPPGSPPAKQQKIKSESDGTKYQFLGNPGNKNIQQHNGDGTSQIQSMGKSTEKTTKFHQPINSKAKNKAGEETYRFWLRKHFNQM